MSVRGYGETQPVAPNTKSDGSDDPARAAQEPPCRGRGDAALSARATPWGERLGALATEPAADGLTLHVARRYGERRRGLAGMEPMPADHALHIRTSSVHTAFGMRFDLDLVWLGRDGSVVRIDRAVPPRRMRTCLRARSSHRGSRRAGRSLRAIRREELLTAAILPRVDPFVPRRSHAFLESRPRDLVPVPRRFDRRPPERDLTRINERIRVPEVRLIDDEGNQVGVLKTPDALRFAQERDLDLVEVGPRGPPAGVPGARLLQVQVRAGPEAQASAQAPAADNDPRDQVPPQDRPARLRHQEAPRRALPQAQGQGQGHDHVPRSRGHPPRARHHDPRPPRRGARRARRSSSSARCRRDAT